MAVDWQSWQTLTNRLSVLPDEILYSGEVPTSGSIASEVRICVTAESTGSLEITLIGESGSQLSSSVQGLTGPRFFSGSGCVSFTIPSEEVSVFNLKIKSRFSQPIGLAIEVRQAVGGGGGIGAQAEASLTAIETSSDAIQGQTDGLELTLSEINGNVQALKPSGQILLDTLNMLFPSTAVQQLQSREVIAFVLEGLKPDGTPNTSPVKYGFGAGSPLASQLPPGGSIEISAPTGCTINLSNVFVQAISLEDGLVISLMEAV